MSDTLTTRRAAHSVESNAIRQKYAIFVPIIDNDYTIAHDIARELCALYGGCTSQEARGYWIDARGKLIVDTIVIIYAYCTDSAARKNRARFFTLIEKVKTIQRQDSVSYTINSQLYFY